MSATIGTPSPRPSAGIAFPSSCQYVHVSELRNAYAEAVATSFPALYGQDSGAFDIPFEDFIAEFTPASLSNVIEDGAEIEHSQVENGEWYDLKQVENGFESVFEMFQDNYDYVDYPIYNADIMRVYDNNDSEVEEAYAELSAMDCLEDSLFGSIARAVHYAIETAYRIDLAEFARNLARELEQVDVVVGTAEY